MLIIILMAFAFVLFVLAGLGVGYYPTPPNPPARFQNFIAWGLALWILCEMLYRGGALLKSGTFLP